MPEFQDLFQEPDDDNEEERQGNNLPPGFIKLPTAFGDIIARAVNAGAGPDGSKLSKDEQEKILASLEYPISNCRNMRESAQLWADVGKMLAGHDRHCQDPKCKLHYEQDTLNPATPGRFQDAVSCYLRLCPDMDPIIVDDALGLWNAMDADEIREDARFMVFQAFYDSEIIFDELTARMKTRANFLKT